MPPLVAIFIFLNEEEENVVNVNLESQEVKKKFN
jgi:hypothetical protein